MPSLTIASWNVNSVKSRLHQLLPWLREAGPDMVLLQETKTVDHGFPAMEIEELGYHLALSGQKSYNGVAILSKLPLEDVTRALPCLENIPDEEARYIEAVACGEGVALRVASVYVPNGQSTGSEKFPYKLRFLDRLRAHMRQRLELEEIMLLGGDFNVAADPIDLYDPVGLEGTICYHPEERKRFHSLLHLGLTDAFRALHPQEKAFTWWDYRARGFDAQKGLRIDYLLASPQAADRMTDCRILEKMRGGEKPSDHAPVLCTIEV
jgi:exodeoxyribonuclease-3